MTNAEKYAKALRGLIYSENQSIVDRYETDLATAAQGMAEDAARKVIEEQEQSRIRLEWWNPTTAKDPGYPSPR